MNEKPPRRRLSIITIAIIIILIIIVIVLGILKVNKVIRSKKDLTNNDLVGYMELVQSSNDVFTFIDLQQKVHKFEGYKKMSNFYYNVACVSIQDTDQDYKDKYELINNKEKVIVAADEYDYITQEEGGKFYRVEKSGKEGIIDYNGKVIIPIKYQYISDHSLTDDIHIFICKNDNEEYEYINENGIVITKLDSYEQVSFYTTKVENVVAIKIKNIVYNSINAKQICDSSNIDKFLNNVLVYKEKYELYDNDLNLIKTIECPNAVNVNVTSYDKYTIVNLDLNMDATQDEKNKKYTLYDSKWNVVKESPNEFTLHKFSDGNVVILEEVDSNVIVSDEHGNELFVASNHRLPSGYNESMYLVIPQKGSKIYDIYDIKGKKLIEKGVRSQSVQLGGKTEKDYMVITRNNDIGSYDMFILLKNLDEIPIENDVNILEKKKDNILLSNWKTKIVKLYSKDKKIGEDIQGKYSTQIGKYSIIENDTKYKVINLDELNICFTFESSNLIKIHENIGVVELKSGFYSLDGKLLLEKE